MTFVKLRQLPISSNSVHFSLELRWEIGLNWLMESCQGQTGVKVPSHKYFIKLTISTFRHQLAFSQDGDNVLYTGIKTIMNISEHGHFSTSGQLHWVIDQRPFFVFMFCLNIFLLSPQHFDPHCASQSVVDSSSNKIFAPLPCYE